MSQGGFAIDRVATYGFEGQYLLIHGFDTYYNWNMLHQRSYNVSDNTMMALDCETDRGTLP